MKHQILNVLTIFVQVPVVADWFLVTCSRKRDLYSRHKTTHLTEDADSASVTDFSPSLSLMILVLTKILNVGLFVCVFFVTQVSMGTTYGTQ